MKVDITIGEGVVLRPGDTVLVKSKTLLSPEQIKNLRSAFEANQLAGVRWLVFPPEFEFVIKRGDGTE